MKKTHPLVPQSEDYFTMRRILFPEATTPIQRIYHALCSTLNVAISSALSLCEIVSLVGIARHGNKLYDNSDTYDFTEVKDWDFPSRAQHHVFSSQDLRDSERLSNSKFRYPLIDFMCSILCSLYRVIIVVVYAIVFVNAYAGLAILPDQKLRATISERMRIYKDHAMQTLDLIQLGLWESLRDTFSPHENDGVEDSRHDPMVCSLCDDRINISRVASVAIGKRDAESMQSKQIEASLSCPHVFCTPCISRWARTEWSNHRRATCPFCREPFSMVVSCSQISFPHSYVDEGFSLTPPVFQENFMHVCEVFLVAAFCAITSFTTSRCFNNDEDGSTYCMKILFLLTLIPWTAKWIPFHLVDFAVLAPLVAYDQVSFQTWTLSLFAILAYRDEVRAVRILSGLLTYQAVMWVCLKPQVLQNTIETTVSFVSRISVPWLVALSTVLLWSYIQTKRYAESVLKEMKKHRLLKVFMDEGIFSIIALSFKWVVERIWEEWEAEKELRRKNLLVLWVGVFVMQAVLWPGFLLVSCYITFHMSCLLLTIGAQVANVSLLPEASH